MNDQKPKVNATLTNFPDTTEFSLTIGMVPGYFNHVGGGVVDGRDIPTAALHYATSVFQFEAEALANEHGTLVTGVVEFAVAAYSPLHGCPRGGEPIVHIFGVRNPAHNPDDMPWRDAVTTLAAKLAERFDQTTAYLSFREVSFHYIERRSG